jgi:hypothetical protein
VSYHTVFQWTLFPNQHTLSRSFARSLAPSPTLTPTDPVPRGLLTLCPAPIYMRVRAHSLVWPQDGPHCYTHKHRHRTSRHRTRRRKHRRKATQAQTLAAPGRYPGKQAGQPLLGKDHSRRLQTHAHDTHESTTPLTHAPTTPATHAHHAHLCRPRLHYRLLTLCPAAYDRRIQTQINGATRPK